ncbi:hypothetical protein PoB_004676400 [Plakobranchus ocellatus]|uniref:Uncharacterized protein n=1 Tax=Plakobranchus ocellatus TaxID=259542 RepID=A0AAV4BN02_9GAST|nr:hypothetical protein PoB_004676400 [Plakobranchus ocellatus]
MAAPFPLSNRATDLRPGCKTQMIAPMLRLDGSRSRLGVLSSKETRVFPNMSSWTRELLPPIWARPYIYGLAFRQWLYWIMETGCHYVITHNSSDRCRANHEASLIGQIIRLIC